VHLVYCLLLQYYERLFTSLISSHLTSPRLTSSQPTSFHLKRAHRDWSQPRQTESCVRCREANQFTVLLVQTKRGQPRWGEMRLDEMSEMNVPQSVVAESPGSKSRSSRRNRRTDGQTDALQSNTTRQNVRTHDGRTLISQPLSPVELSIQRSRMIQIGQTCI